MQKKIRCAITGATGFIGGALLAHLRQYGHEVHTWPRTDAFNLANDSTTIPDEWIKYLQGVDVIFHLAGLAHQPRLAQDASRYFQINRDGTLRLAAAARAAGVKRFIFISSAKIFGEGGNTIYSAATEPSPIDAYAQSKWQAEQQLIEQFSHTMEIVILRPPLVYGRDAKANFASLIRLAQLPVPLPFKGIKNRRALIGLDNLIDLITLCMTSPAAAGKTFLCADADTYSLSDIVASMRRTTNRDPHLFRLPVPLFNALKALLGTGTSARLFGDFQMDCSETYQTLNWKPPFTMEQILRGCTRDSTA